MNRLAPILATVLALGLPLGGARGGPDGGRTGAISPDASDPIAHGAHGAVFGPDGRQRHADAAFVRRAQAHYAARLHALAAPHLRAAHANKLQAAVALAAGDVQTELHATSLLLDWYIGEVQPADQAVLRARNSVLLRLLAWRLPDLADGADAAGTRWTPGDFVQAMLAQSGLLPSPQAVPPFAVGQQRERYQKECVKAGVPVPPDWGKADWKSAGVLGQTFIINDQRAEVYYWSTATPAGVCLALPRYTAGNNDTDTLGIICMGEKTVNDAAGNARNSACFWDWEGPGTTKVTGEVRPLIEFAAGPALDEGIGGPCSDCHAGENAFIVHPAEAPFKNPMLPSLASTGWVTPLVKAAWHQNPLPTATEAALGAIVLNAGEGDCLSCHRLPEIPTPLRAGDTSYCSLLGISVQGLDLGGGRKVKLTMPPSGKKDYSRHVKALDTLCRAVGAPFLP